MSADAEQVNPLGLTDQQQRAITARDASVALSAGAGCGKTFVLTERFLAELDPDGPSDKPRLGQLVAITFTERAAREMRDRIRGACHRRLLECPEHQVDYWLELIRDLDSARISTIHAFCATLLRAHAVEVGIDPRFRILDGAQAGTLLFQLSDEVLRDRLAERDEAALALVTRFGLDRLRDMIARLLAVRQEIDWPEWRRETPEGLTTRWQRFWLSDTVPRVLRGIAESTAARTVLDLALRYPPAHPMMRERCDFLLEELSKLAEPHRAAGDELAPLDRLAAIREAAKVQGGGSKKDWVSEDVYGRFRDAAKALRDAIDAVKSHMRFDAEAARPVAATALQVVGLAADLTEQYDRKKQELAVLDFNDLLIHARALLVGSNSDALRRRLAAQIHLLLVDEFQDTDPLQVEMLKALCDNQHLRGKLFLVGDYKQSIYRFRGADPHVFRRLRSEIPEAGRLPLSLNFRSQPAVLDFINGLFAEELGPDYEPLRPHRPQVGPTPAVEFLWACDTEDDAADNGAEAPTRPSAGPAQDSEEEVMPATERRRRREADWIARRIRAMLDTGEQIVWDEQPAKAGKPVVRSVRPGDVALLFRALTNVEYYEEALRRYGINYYLVGGHAFYAQQEVFDLLNLLRAVNSPCDEVSLAGALRSPLFGLFDETLFWLTRHERGLAAGLFDAELPAELESAQRQRVEWAAATLGQLRAMKDRLPVAQLIQQALDRTGYDALLLAEFLGERKLANLHKLIEQARSFDRTGVFALSDFITQLSEFVARQPDEALAATHPESTDVVKLMSIHQSKGLEFPVVVIPDVGRPRRAIGPTMAFTRQLGPMYKEADVTTGYDLYRMAENEEEMAELGRLLYVATTRAADYLILSAGMDAPGQITGPWMELIGRRFDLLNGEYRAATGGRARVTTTTPPIDSKPVDLRRRRDLMKIVDKARQMADDGAGRLPRYLATVLRDPSARRQYSFSRLTGKLHVHVTDFDTDSFETESSAAAPLDARGLGSLVHAVLAEVDFARPGAVADLVRRHAEEHLADAEHDLAEPIDMIERFLASPRAAQIAAAETTYRELEFLLAWPPEGDADQTRGRCLKGFIDCLYCDAAGQWRLIDYKTNRVTPETLATVAAQYESQMLLYALAAEQILKRPPTELVLCFLRPGLEHRFHWDAASRQRVAGLVDRAIS